MKKRESQRRRKEGRLFVSEGCFCQNKARWDISSHQCIDTSVPACPYRQERKEKKGLVEKKWWVTQSVAHSILLFLFYCFLLPQPKHLPFSHSLPSLCISLPPSLQQTRAQSATTGTAVLRYSTSRGLRGCCWWGGGRGRERTCGVELAWGTQ